MKKVILTTFFMAENYGAVLQAYALQSVLQQKDLHIEVLNYRDSDIEDVYRRIHLNHKSLWITLCSCISYLLFWRKNKIRHEKFKKFRDSYLQVGKEEYWSAETLMKNPPQADVYITGSDQVWNTLITKGLSDVYTLNFGSEEVRRIAYAASIGNGQIVPEQVELFREKIKIIDDLSVREDTAKEVLGQFVDGKKIFVALDPVLLRDKSDWEKDLAGFESKEEKYILAYHVEKNEEYRKTVEEVSKKFGFKVIHFEKWKRYWNTLNNAYTAGPLEFVSLIQHAEYVITNSFHGTAFSIIFHKKFWVFPHRQTGSRVNDLLSLLGISERAVQTFEEFSSKDYDSEIDYVRVEKILTQERKKSLEWLENALKKSDDLK